MRMEEQDEKIASLIGGLERVDAPHGFESRVMRRVAERGSEGEFRQPVFFLVLKFAAPAAMLLLFGTFFIFFGDREVSTSLVPPVQEVDKTIAPTRTDDAPPINGTLAAAAPSDQRPAIQQPASTSRPQPSSSPRIMSEDFAVQGPGEVLTPPSLDQGPKNLDPGPASPKGGVTVKDLLSNLGANASCGADGCRVSSVTRNSFADRAGVAAGDRIVSIDGRAVKAGTEFSGSSHFKTFQVVRDGRLLNLSHSSN